MDDTGFDTRGGKRFAWADVTAIRREQATINGNLANDMLRLTCSTGTAYLPLFRTDDPRAVLDYALRHLPPTVAKG